MTADAAATSRIYRRCTRIDRHEETPTIHVTWKTCISGLLAALLILATHSATYADTPDIDASGGLAFDEAHTAVDVTVDTIDASLDADETFQHGLQPDRVWTTDAYGWSRSAFRRGESMTVWLEIYNPSRYSLSEHVTLINEKPVMCILPFPAPPCDPFRQVLHSGYVSLRPGLNRFYMATSISYYAEPGDRTIRAEMNGSSSSNSVQILP